MHSFSNPQPTCKVCRHKALWFFRGVVLAAGGDPKPMKEAESW
jgi:hypothetical protein